VSSRIIFLVRHYIITDKQKPDDTFVEKLATQIIKNVQVKITDIHVRYEDKVTKPEHPFSLGITLHNLSVHTTDENWKACIVQDAATMIYKVRSHNIFHVH
jgi:vacuolar protein sorting-associated protein 13A/C